jgi:hypothetical protein
VSARALAASALLLLAGCVETPAATTEEVLGNFELTAEPISSSCTYAEAGGGALAFTIRVARALDGGEVTVTLNGIERPATFDGQVLRTSYVAPRTFADCSCSAEQRDAGCACSGVTLEEQLEVALVSLEQDEVLGRACPAAPLDGGVPTVGPDGGALALPVTTPRGFDAVRACGELWDGIQPGEGCFCAACSMRYAVRGVRR